MVAAGPRLFPVEAREFLAGQVEGRVELRPEQHCERGEVQEEQHGDRSRQCPVGDGVAKTNLMYERSAQLPSDQMSKAKTAPGRAERHLRRCGTDRWYSVARMTSASATAIGQ